MRTRIYQRPTSKSSSAKAIKMAPALVTTTPSNNIAQRVLQLQQTIGNSATVQLLRPQVQRALTITNYNTKQGGQQEDADLNIANLNAAVNSKVSDVPDRNRVLQNITAQNVLNLAHADVQAMATALATGTTRVATVGQVRDAIGSILLNTNDTEVALWDKLLLRATTKSRQKGTPGTISADNLETAVNGSKAIIAAIRKLDTQLKTPDGSKVAGLSVDAWVTAMAGDLNARTAHDNGAGWLQPVNSQADYTAIQLLVAANVTAWKQSNPRRAGKTDDELAFSATMKLLPDQRRIYAWAAHGGVISSYIEFGVPGEKDGRLVFDYVNNRVYFTPHYNWHLGYNPFFEVT